MAKLLQKWFLFYPIVISALFVSACGDSSVTVVTTGEPVYPFNAGYGYVHSGTTPAAAGLSGSNQLDIGRTVRIDSKGRIVVAGYSQYIIGGYNRVALWRYKSDGTLDSTFGTGGIVTSGPNSANGSTSAQFGNDFVQDMEIDSQGRIVVTGYTRKVGAGTQTAVWRYNEDGTLDSTFGAGGIVVGSSTGLAGGLTTGQNDVPQAVVLNSKGQIIITGFSQTSTGGSYKMFIERHLLNGFLDPTFGTGGLVLSASSGTTAAGGTVANLYELGSDVVVDSQDRVIVAGPSKNNTPSSELALWRYTADGILDSTFGTAGVVHYGATSIAGATGANQFDFPSRLAVDSQGRILVAGYSQTSTSGSWKMFLVRYSAAGVLDSSFGTAGVVLSAVGGTTAAGGTGSNLYELGNDVKLDSQNRILVAGVSRNAAGRGEMALWRYTGNGTLDSTFGTGGIVHFGTTGAAGATGIATSDAGNSLAIDALDRVAVTGSSRNAGAGAEMAVWRYLSTGVLDK